MILVFIGDLLLVAASRFELLDPKQTKEETKKETNKQRNKQPRDRPDPDI
jgi:hypothetical protein